MKILFLNQCFYPDVVSTAQHLADLAGELARQGHEVTVLAGRRGYDHPRVRFPPRETWKGVEIIRVYTPGLGKGAKWRRAVDFGAFFLGASVRLAVLPPFDVVVAMTSPPVISSLGAAFVRLKGGRLVFWAMDLNPDEAIAAGWLKEGGAAARLLDSSLRYSLRRATKVIVLDRFMKQRLLDKEVGVEKLSVIPPWSHDRAVRYDEAGRESFRALHGLSQSYVVMYAGNHSPCHPLDTLLEAADRLRERAEIVFCFMGGGSEYEKVRAFARARRLETIRCLPYQPLEGLAAALSAADLHVVVMGNSFPGIVHPCKIYNILATGRPFVYIGPDKSHISDLLPALGAEAAANHARHGDVEHLARRIAALADRGAGRAAWVPAGVLPPFSEELLVRRMIAVLEAVAAGATERAVDAAPAGVQSLP